ncbi:hypothetical protein FB567DRAFT_599457 [Paraphoma chrysanthemicola]|uniref:Protein kinase domain-containing protein n=1 Tax=Paraphoma chrysanthemicola TaxID=798071 RepID=A0A8K0VS38_9PLEO|nr:hypothetical protein FB567DRAFT_599457 [Paraphoma chrysanthemicola]
MVEAALEDSIVHRTKTSAFSKRRFLPQDALDELLVEDRIWHELNENHIIDGGELTRYIKQHARKIFATLVSCGLVEKARTLRQHGITDDYLPVALDSNTIISLNGFPKDDKALAWFQSWRKKPRATAGTNPFSKVSPRESGKPELHGQTEPTLDTTQIRLFCEKQWLVLAKVFSREQVIEDLHPDCPLPLLTYEKSGGGGFSTLHYATIEPSHQLGIIDGTRLAIKELIDEKAAAENAYDIEVDALDLARKLNHDFMVKFVAGFQQNSKRYLMFQWVDGGNLREFWENHTWCRDATTIHWALKQMMGLVDALHQWHNYYKDSQKKYCRHGDLKPENIVRAITENTPGSFQIADLGLAKIHTLPTNLRKTDSGGFSGTSRYQSPEVRQSITGAISRAYDMWSIGCILLEFLIWLLYGRDELNRFNDSFKDSFFVFDDGFCLHPCVQQWIDHINSTSLTEQGHCISPALRQLFRVIRDRLLIEDQTIQAEQQDSTEYDFQFQLTEAIDMDGVVESRPSAPRAKIEELHNELSNILLREDPQYYHDFIAENDGLKIQGPKKSPTFLAPATSIPSTHNRSTSTASASSIKTLIIGDPKNPYATPTALDVWTTHSDNRFAKEVFSSLIRREFDEVRPNNTKASRLCARCSNADSGLLSRGYSVDFDYLARSRFICTVCDILYMKQSIPEIATKATTFFRKGNALCTTSGDTTMPILSMVVGPGSNVPYGDVPKGFPILPKAESNIQIKLFREWIKDCDAHHECKPDVAGFMPTRLIDLKGGSSSKALRLDCSKDRKDTQYIALTHRWGAAEDYKRFCLWSDNLEQWQSYINLEKLPLTFQHAAKITRRLDIRYLWIDSMCIVQNDPADVRKEISTMEDVFSSAYLTLSATRSAGIDDGFLQPRAERSCYSVDVPFESGGVAGSSKIHLCGPIDDFKRDVEQSELSKRGWVFQERALSRRIIHFTETQTYWECGKGIRCESLTKLINQRTSFMSDPEFPKSMLKHYKGMRILFFENIYSDYSQLRFSDDTDRSIGIAGIETRLARVYDARAKFGILHDPQDRSYLRRSLLWQNAEASKPLKPIEYPESNRIPSWSWMAVMGRITYMSIPFDSVEWSEDVKAPFNPAEHEINRWPNQQGYRLAANARNFSEQDGDHVVMDRPLDRANTGLLKCVVFGTEKAEEPIDLERHYTLLITPLGPTNLYTRIGVATFERDKSWAWMDVDPVYIL